MSMMEFSGKDVYVGIDVHKKKYVITAMCDGLIVKRASCPPRPGLFANSLQKWFGGAQIKTVYEAGFSGFYLHRTLVTSGIESIVVNPSSIEVASNDRVKTDKRDSKKMAEQLATGRLRSIYIPSLKEELARLLPRTRDQLVRLRSRIAIQIKSKLMQFGFLDHEDDRGITGRFLDEIEATDLPYELQVTVGVMSTQWRHVSQKIKEMEKALAEQAKEQPAIESIYRSAPGVGVVTARVLATELGDMARFKSEKSLFSYTGFTPSEYSSGEFVRRGHISRQGNARVRAILVEAAWRAIGDDPDLRKIYDRIMARRGGKIAIVAVARKLIGRIRACFVCGIPYRAAESI